MKIAHIGNTAGTASTIAKELHRRGHIADVFVFDVLTEMMFDGHRVNYNSHIAKFLFHRKLRSYDICHYHSPYGTLKKNLENDNKKGKIKLLKHYHGSDLRTTGIIEKDFCLVSTPDLLKFTPNGRWLPNPLNLDFIYQFRISDYNRDRQIRVAHYPYYEINKQHQDNYSQVLCSLAILGKCNFTRIIGVKHSEALKMISESDIVIGKVMPEMGWFSTFELEGMALGKPVIAYISDELYEKYKPPVFRTGISTFRQDLIKLIEDEKMRKDLGSRGSEYVKKYHSCDKIVNILHDYYQKIMA